jgi:hypothetical protein
VIKGKLEIVKRGNVLLKPDVLEVRLQKAIKQGVEQVMKEAKREAEALAEKKGIVPDTGPKADRPYNKSFKIKETRSGKKLEWSSSLVNDAADAKVQEYGRRPNRKMPPAKPIEEWMERKKLFNQDFLLNRTRNKKGKLVVANQPRNKKGQFKTWRKASRSSRIWLMRKHIQRKGRKAHLVMKDLKNKLGTKRAKNRMLLAIREHLR